MDRNFIIDQEIQSLLPRQTSDEIADMEANLLDGLHVDKLVIGILDGQRILVDGHTRLPICERHGIPYETRDKKFRDRQHMIEWVIRNQLGRRNLTDELRSVSTSAKST